MKTQTNIYIKMNRLHKPSQNKAFNNRIKIVENVLMELNNKRISVFSYL